MAGKRVYRRHRRLKSWAKAAVLVLLLGVVVGAALLLNSCGGKGNTTNSGSGQGSGEPSVGNIDDSTVNNSPSEQDDSQQAEAPELPVEDPYAGYTMLTMTEDDMHRGELILVSNEHAYTFPEGIEDELVTIIDHKSGSYTVNLYETMVLPVTVEHLNELMDDYVAQGGQQDVMVVSGYRTYDFQQGLFDRSAARNGLEHAQRFVAQPGGSEHHTGYAVDLYSTTQGDYLECTGEYAWIGEHCHEYGFILRYTSEKEEYTKIGPESWHFRYVGVPHAYIIVENGFCYEEYVDYLRQFPFDGEHLTYTLDGTEYEIYFVEGLEVPVPEEGEYTVSGNNVDGFIVTVTKGS